MLKRERRIEGIIKKRALLTSFRRVKVRAHLVPLTKFMLITKGRVIISKNDIPFTMYFILSGEVEMIKRSSSKLYGRNIDEVESIYGPGECIGEMAMLEKSVRSHTFLAASQCEVLVVFENAMPIIEPFMKKRLVEKKRALNALDYFDFLNEEQIGNACRFGTIRQYQPLDTIYSQDMGSLTDVHFVLSGECIILQCLNMKVTMKNGKKVFNLPQWKCDDAILKFSNSSHPLNNDTDVEIQNLVKTSETSEAEKTEIIRMNNMNILPNVEENGNSSTESEVLTITSSHSGSNTSDSKNFESYNVNIAPGDSNIEKYETHFIDVGSVGFGGIFGLGEKMEDRVILARTTVQCLTLPRYFLLEKKQNPDNIWQRRLFYLDCTIPSREALFKEFLDARNWREFKKNYIYKNLDPNVKDVSKTYDIPIICRIVENVDDI